jgi:uncharacterized protein YbjQ (UPF0145 family)
MSAGDPKGGIAPFSRQEYAVSDPSELFKAARYALHTEKNPERALSLAKKIILECPVSVEATEAARLFRELKPELAELDALRSKVETERQGRLREARERAPRQLLMLSTTDEIDGFRTIRNLGVVRGNTVRSRHVGSDLAAGLKSIVGGELRGATQLIADGREQAFARMCSEAESLGANAVKGLRFSTSQVWEGAAEVMAYGTAVVVEPIAEEHTETGI